MKYQTWHGEQEETHVKVKIPQRINMHSLRGRPRSRLFNIFVARRIVSTSPKSRDFSLISPSSSVRDLTHTAFLLRPVAWMQIQGQVAIDLAVLIEVKQMGIYRFSIHVAAKLELVSVFQSSIPRTEAGTEQCLTLLALAFGRKHNLQDILGATKLDVAQISESSWFRSCLIQTAGFDDDSC
jgi:hypothetical protein